MPPSLSRGVRSLPRSRLAADRLVIVGGRLVGREEDDLAELGTTSAVLESRAWRK